jgi:hypothetical protein
MISCNKVFCVMQPVCAFVLALALSGCGGGGGGTASTVVNNTDPSSTPGTTTTTGTTTTAPPAAASVSGTIYYIFAGEMNKLDVATGVKTKMSSQGTFDAGFLDVSADSKELMYVRDAPGSDGGNWYDQEYFNLVNINDFSQVNSRFKKFSSTGARTIFAKLSPDKSKIAVIARYCDETYDSGVCKSYANGVRVWDRNGNILVAFNKDNSGNRVKEFAWLPDGNLLMTTDLGIVKTTDTTLTTFELLFKPSVPSWRSVVSSPDGKRLALKSGRHVYTMNIDGSNVVQVTDSEGDDQEYSPIWSPDGKYIAFTTNIFSYTTGPIVAGGGTIYQMILAPADNKTYKISKNFSETLGAGGLTGSSSIVATNGLIVLKTGPNSDVFSEEDFIWR